MRATVAARMSPGRRPMIASAKFVLGLFRQSDTPGPNPQPAGHHTIDSIAISQISSFRQNAVGARPRRRAISITNDPSPGSHRSSSALSYNNSPIIASDKSDKCADAGFRWPSTDPPLRPGRRSAFQLLGSRSTENAASIWGASLAVGIYRSFAGGEIAWRRQR